MISAKLDYRPAIRALQQAATAIGRTEPLMRTTAGIMFREVEDNFAAEGRPKWKDLHPGTKASRAKQGTWPGKILQRSGGLVASIQQQYSASQAVVGTNKVYARILHDGGKTRPHVIVPRTKRALSFGGIVVRKVNHPGSNIPARPFLVLSPEGVQDIVEEAGLHVSRNLPK